MVKVVPRLLGRIGPELTLVVTLGLIRPGLAPAPTAMPQAAATAGE